MKDEKIKIYDSNSSMEHFKQILKTMDPNKESEYFKKIWDDLDKYEKKTPDFAKDDKTKK